MYLKGQEVASPQKGHAMTDNATRYEQDFYRWAQEQAVLLREGAWPEVDVSHLIEEVEGLAINEKHALGSHLKNLVMHLLKWHYEPQGRQTGHSWQDSIHDARDEIAQILEDSPSLRREVPALLTRRYPAARRKASTQTTLPLRTFPEACPWDIDQVLDPDFWPEEGLRR